MARQADEISGGGGGEISYDLRNLRTQVQTLCDDFDAQADMPLDQREELRKIFDVLKEIKLKIGGDDAGKAAEPDDDDKLLPQSKREELGQLLPLIRDEFQKRKPQQQQKPAGAADRPAAASAGDKKDLQQQQQQPSAAAATGCYPCKLRPATSQQQQRRREAEKQDDEIRVSLELLHRLAKNVLEPEVYYEWTTSYVDEERIYGWVDKADEVAASLVAPDGDPRMFRAAGIAGVHGSGKTALAQKVFVHDKSKDNFAIRLWVCVGPPDSEDRFNLLYRMLDNLGLDTAKVEDDIVAKANVVKEAISKEEERILNGAGDAAPVNQQLRKEAADRARTAAAAAAAKDTTGGQKQAAAENTAANKPDDGQLKDADAAKAKKTESEKDRIFQELLKKKVDGSDAVKRSKYGVLLYILHVTLSKTSYLIVFDDIRAYDGPDGWYSNLTLPPPAEGEWGDRLAYGLPKGGGADRRGAVLVTCRKEDDARIMVRTGRVFNPPWLEVDDAWKLFTREYRQAKDDAATKKQRGEEGGGNNKAAAAAGEDHRDMLLEDLEKMKKQIVNKCLGLPVAIIEAAKGFAALEPLPYLPEKKEGQTTKPTKTASSAATATNKQDDDDKKGAQEEEEEAAKDDGDDKGAQD